MSAVDERPAADFIGVARLAARLRQAFAAAVADDPELAGLGLRPPTFGVLRILASVGPQSQRQLSDRIGLHPSDMVALIDDIEGRGWVSRERDPDDRRRYAVALTEGGRAVLGRLEGVATTAGDGVLAPLDADERATLRTLLGRLLAE